MMTSAEGYEIEVSGKKKTVTREFTHAMMMASAKSYKIEESGKGAVAKLEVEVSIIDTDLGWFKFKERLWAKVEATFRISDVPLI